MFNCLKHIFVLSREQIFHFIFMVMVLVNMLDNSFIGATWATVDTEFSPIM